MSPHLSSLLLKIAAGLQEITQRKQTQKQCLIGFDGFTDEILHAVDQRSSPTAFTRIETIEQFGARIIAAAGKSANIELVPQRTKLGGNAPILTNALLEGGHSITFVGAIGTPGNIEPLFQNMAARCAQVYSLCPSGHSDAVEFTDGKLIFGKHAPLINVNYENLLKAIPALKLIASLSQIDLFVCVNWTMLLSMNDLWQKLLQNILPHVQSKEKKRPWMFVDLADPAKRSDEELQEAIKLLQELKKYYRVILALNEAEGERIGKLYGHHHSAAANIQTLASAIRKHTALDQIIVHIKKCACVVAENEQATIFGPFCSCPRLTTGAGDNFNAGYCNGLLHGFSPTESLALGVSASSYYVRNAKSPSIGELTQFLKDWNNGAFDSCK